MKKILFFILIFIPSLSFSDSVTNKISTNLRGTMYTQQSTTSNYAKNNYSGSTLNCIQYAYRISSVAKENNKESEIWKVAVDHAIVIVKDGSKRYCYSNGKLVKEESYSKLYRIK